MKRIAVCGVSNRAIGMYIGPIIEDFSHNTQLVALLDIDPRRFEVCSQKHAETSILPTYKPEQFDQMITDTRADTVLVVGVDRTHADYIISALEKGLNVITEKPMATTAKDCRRILDAEANSKGKVTVTFNYRYAPAHTKIKEMVSQGKLGRITSVDLNWYVDTYHGASYFKRWNRMRDSSGGLSIHKSTHHFDLVNWWINQKPVQAFAFGALNYYGPNGEHNPSKRDGRHCEECEEFENCVYLMRWRTRGSQAKPKDDHLGTVDVSTRPYTNYRPDQCIFDSAINIEDTYSATIKYDQGALLTYSINFSLPYEGYSLAINGTKGRLETRVFNGSRTPFPIPETQTIDFMPLFGSAKETIYVVNNEGGHGGGDPVLREDLFLGVDPNRDYEILSGALEGAYSVVTGEAVWRSVKENKPISITELLNY